MKWMARLEKKFGKYAIKNLSFILIGCYIVGYMLRMAEGFTKVPITEFLTLNPYAIVHGQVWRIVSWLLIPPMEQNFIFTIIMLFFYLSIGRTLEQAWGDFQYNLYIFSGMLFTLIGSFVVMGISTLRGSALPGTEYLYYNIIGQFFSTYYINMSLFLAYATTFPDNQVLLLFFIPIRVKWLGFIYGAYLIYETVTSVMGASQFGIGYVPAVVVGASLLNFLVFFLTTRNYLRMNRAQRKAHKAYERQARQFEKAKAQKGFTKHKCAVCHRTEKDGENLTFRFCSKCEGNYEYCQDHLYTHIHFTGQGHRE